MRARILRDGGSATELVRELGQGAGDARAWLEQGARIIKSDRHSAVGLLELAGRPCFIKYYQAKSPLQAMWFRIGTGRACRAFDAAVALGQRSQPVAAPLACLGVPGGQLLLTEAIADARDLKALWLQGLQAPRLQQLMEQAGLALAELHGAGFVHGDCKWSNLLWNGDRFYLVDLEAVRPVGAGRGGVARDLARFTLNGEDMGLEPDAFEAFLRAYGRESGLPREQLVAGILPPLRRLRRRHLTRYGARGGALLPD